ncbi:aminotransferase class V-fold PLP-dependent enzyme [Opitutia bacterium ISCC 51]|nr:aminotransferase class V-fold PLP-dependent enzyme [Opitutae bacterium ISCC 51]QXD29503.1 aminotransferase class V-fold PLP-dependent enzyme [Opitutae bacterium ISCC 52]
MSVSLEPLIEKPLVDPALFALDPNLVFLNHGSFGACPHEVLAYQSELRQRMERQPVHFFQREMEALLDEARSAVSEFVGCDSDDLVFVANATSGVNTILRSIPFEPGDELLVSNHEYNACRNAIHFVADQCGAKVITIDIPFPIASEDEVVEAVMNCVTEKTRLLLIDHVTSQTGLVLPIKRIIDLLEEKGIETLIDGAHAPGMIPLNLKELGATYYTGNCHKWICAPKSAALLYIRKVKQQQIRPLSISHGANSPRTDRSRLQIEFAWMGTRDPTSALSVPFVINYLNDIVPGGWPALMDRNRRLALKARRIYCDSYNAPMPSPDSMIGSLVSIPIFDSRAPKPIENYLYLDHWQYELIKRSSIEVPILAWPAFPRRLVRFSCQAYNFLSQYELLGEAIKELVDDQFVE